MGLEWRPNLGKQELFHRSSAFEVFYGGQAGGGKSDSLLVESARYVDVRGYNAILFRRTYPELWGAGGLIPRSFELFSGCARWSGQTHTWTFPSGATISFGHMRYPQDRYAYQGHAYAYVGFDELTHFTEEQYLYLFSRTRTSCGIPARIRSASNPGNIGHEWVKKRFIAPFKDHQPGTIRYFARVNEEDTEVSRDQPNALSRTFIPASVYDNPPLLENNPRYIAILQALPYIERKRLLEGDWDVQAAGNVFDPAWFGIVERAPEGLSWVRYWDLAISTKTTADYTASAGLALDDEGNLYVKDMVRERWPWHKAKKEIKRVILEEEEWFAPQREKRRKRIFDVREWNRKPHHKPLPLPPSITYRHGVERDIIGMVLFEELMAEPELVHITIEPVKPEGDKLSRALPWSARAEQKKVFLVDGDWIPAFLSECREFSGDGLTHDDQVDTVGGGLKMIATIRGVQTIGQMFYD